MQQLRWFDSELSWFESELSWFRVEMSWFSVVSRMFCDIKSIHKVKTQSYDLTSNTGDSFHEHLHEVITHNMPVMGNSSTPWDPWESRIQHGPNVPLCAPASIIPRRLSLVLTLTSTFFMFFFLLSWTLLLLLAARKTRRSQAGRKEGKYTCPPPPPPYSSSSFCQRQEYSRKVNTWNKNFIKFAASALWCKDSKACGDSGLQEGGNYRYTTLRGGNGARCRRSCLFLVPPSDSDLSSFSFFHSHIQSKGICTWTRESLFISQFQFYFVLADRKR